MVEKNKLAEYCDGIKNTHDRVIAMKAFVAGYDAGLQYADKIHKDFISGNIKDKEVANDNQTNDT